MQEIRPPLGRTAHCPSAPAEFRSLRLGGVRYLNSRPLCDPLPTALPGANIVYDVPSQLAQQLEGGRLDVGLVPTVELFRGRGYRVFGDACVACDGPVWSVKLLFRVAPPEVRTLAADVGSRTSVILAQVLLDPLAGTRPAITPLPLDADVRSTDADAVLLIGDRAMNAPGGFREQWDLGEQWKNWTGLPFVFAAWIGPPRADAAALARALSTARDMGVADIETIIAANAQTHSLGEAQTREYLTRRLRYSLTERTWAGLSRFYEQARSLGLVEAPWEAPANDCIHV